MSGGDGRFRLNVSCVRQRSDDGGVRKPTASILLRAPRSKCLMGEGHHLLRANEIRSGHRASEPTNSSPTRCDLTGGSDCLHQRVIQGASSDSVGDPFAQRSRSVPRRSLTGSPGTTAATFRKRPSRGMNHFSWHVARHFRSLQFVCWSSVERAEPSESSVANLRAWRLIGPNGPELHAGDPTEPSPTVCDARTRPLTRVSHEKRNADQCPPTGGEPDRHR